MARIDRVPSRIEPALPICLPWARRPEERAAAGPEPLSRAKGDVLVNPLLKSLRGRHGIVQDRIDAEQSRPRPDALRLKTLKKLKLFVRDRIEFLERKDRGKPPVVVVTRRAPRRLAPVQAS